MRILIDAFNISLSRGTGVATYGRNFLNVVRSMGHHTSLLYGLPIRPTMPEPVQQALLRSLDNPINGKWRNRRERIFGAFKAASGMKACPLPSNGAEPQAHLSHMPPVDERWNSYRLWSSARDAFRRMNRPTEISGIDADIAHWTYPMPIRLRNAKNIYTIHDLVPLTMAELSHDDRLEYYTLIKFICESADHIITVSEKSRSDIIEVFGTDPKRVTNTYQPHDITDEILSQVQSISPDFIRDSCGFEPGKYFVYFGAIEPKKNIRGIIEGYIRSGADVPLLIISAPGWDAAQEMSLVNNFKSSRMVSQIKVLEYLPRSVLLSLVASARATVFPSICEGFGLPILESMALGTPVITSNLGALDEIAGDAAIKVNPFNIEQIADAFRVSAASSQAVARYVDEGRHRADMFSFSAYERALRALFERL